MREDSKPRVGLVIGQLTYGGAEGQLYELATRLAPHCDPVVYCLSASTEPYADRLAAKGIEVRVIASRGALDLTRVVRLARRLKSDRIDVVHAWLFIASAYAYLATRLLPSVALVTSARNCKPEPSALRRRIIGRAFGASDAIICNSAQMAEFAAVHYAAPRGRLRVVYNGVDEGRFSPRGGDAGGALIGTVGRIEAQKNLDLFIAAARKVLKTRPDTVFEVVGKGSLLERYERALRDQGVDHAIRFVGTSDDVPGFLGRLTQFWLTSSWEGTPNVVLEAMAAGVPVLATEVGGVGELIHDGEDGFLFSPDDATAIADRSVRLQQDPEAAAAVGEAARASVRARFSMDAMLGGTVAVYREALDRVRQRR